MHSYKAKQYTKMPGLFNITLCHLNNGVHVKLGCSDIVFCFVFFINVYLEQSKLI